MVTICLQCGDEGWTNSYVYCVKCLNEAVHRYCLDEIPKTLDEFVPWICDDCEAESQRTTHSNSDAKIQEKASSDQIDVDSTITLKKKIISHLAERVENGHCENGAGLLSPHKELNWKDSELVGHCRPSGAESQRTTHSNSDAKIQEKTSSEQIDADSTIKLNKKIISHLAERVENGHCENGARLLSPHKELNSKDSELIGHYRPSGAGTSGNDDYSPMALVGNEPRSPVNSSQLHVEKKVEALANGSSRRARLRKLNDSLLVTTNQSRSSDSTEFDEDAPLPSLSSLASSLSSLATNPKKDISCTLDNFAEQICENIPALQPHKDGQDTNCEKEAEPMEVLSSVSCDKNDVNNISRSPMKVPPVEELLSVSCDKNDGNSISRSPMKAPPVEEPSSVSCDKNDVNSISLSPMKVPPVEEPSSVSCDKNDGNSISRSPMKAPPIEEPSSVSCDKNDADSISQSPMKASPMGAAAECRLRAKPLVDPIWRGNFNIVNWDYIIEGLAGHLSSKACRMVYNEASLLPQSLHLNILPRDVVWPKSFEKTEPTDDNIAMYIFSTGSRYAEQFDLLVARMTKQELAMKAITKNAELLIFTSTELPLSYWKFRDKCYLWGVFRGKPSLLPPRAAGDTVVPI